MYTLLAVTFGILLDFIVGDPQGWFHPVCFIGMLITKTEKCCRSFFPKTNKGEWIGGIVLAVVVVGIAGVIPAIILLLAWMIHPIVYVIAASVLSYYLMATKSLRTESMKVHESLKKKNVAEARYYISMLVGRDTDKLEEEGIMKATVETIAENTSDGCIAPLFYLMLGGPVVGYLYKAINTLDSMVGYKNDTYFFFGKFSARMDDLANLIPARLAAWMMLVATALLKMDTKNAYRIYRRDRKKSNSPNAGQTEAVCAGALHVTLLGDAYYFGKLCHKPEIGDSDKKIEIEDIKRTNNLLYMTVIIAYFMFLIVVVLIRVICF